VSILSAHQFSVADVIRLLTEEQDVR
jgi:hypothetical protein